MAGNTKPPLPDKDDDKKSTTPTIGTHIGTQINGLTIQSNSPDEMRQRLQAEHAQAHMEYPSPGGHLT